MKRVITFGEIMMRLSTPAFARFTQAEQFNVLYAGAEANVASSLAVLGVASEHVTRFPDNDLGKAATQSLMKNGVAVDHIIYGEERIGVYFLENGAMQRASRIIYDRFNSAFAHIKPGMINWDEIMKHASWFHWTGITPAISQGAADVCYEAIQAARKLGVKISGDINYRRNLWQYGKSAKEVMPSLIGMTDLIVAGLTDMENCMGIHADTFESGCAAFMKANPATKIIATTERETVSSSHNRLSGLLWDGRKLHRSREYDITHIVDRIGAGDAFMSGLIYASMQKKSEQDTIEFSTAAGVLKHGIEGDVNLSTVEEIEALSKGENTGRLLR